jgi:hypothetical protein
LFWVWTCSGELIGTWGGRETGTLEDLERFGERNGFERSGLGGERFYVKHQYRGDDGGIYQYEIDCLILPLQPCHKYLRADANMYFMLKLCYLANPSTYVQS